MKRVHEHVILALCAVLLCTVAALPLAAQPADAADAADEPRPKAVVDGAIYDAQRVDVGEKIVHDFVIRNEGDAPLHVTDVRPACGCTVAEYDAVIAPGGSGKVHAVLDTSDEQGGISKGITVLTDDPENPHIVLTIKAVVEPAVYVRPGFARFIQPQLSDPGVVGQLLFASGFENLEVLGVESPYPFLTAAARPAREDEESDQGEGRQWVVELTLDYGKAPVGALADHVKVRTNHPRQPTVEIPVSGFIRPMVVATPHDMNFGAVEVPEEGLSANVLVKNYSNEPMGVELEEPGIPGVSVELEPLQAGREYKLIVTLAPDMPKGAFAGQIELKLDHPRLKSLAIPVHGSRI